MSFDVVVEKDSTLVDFDSVVFRFMELVICFAEKQLSSSSSPISSSTTPTCNRQLLHLSAEIKFYNSEFPSSKLQVRISCFIIIRLSISSVVELDRKGNPLLVFRESSSTLFLLFSSPAV